MSGAISVGINDMRPRIVSSDNPLFTFKGSDWLRVPDELKPYSAMWVNGETVTTNELQAFETANIPVIVQGENYNSCEGSMVIPIATLHTWLSTYDNIIGVSFVEQSCAGLTSTQETRIIDTIEECAGHDALFIWEDMGYTDRKNVFAKAGDDSDIFAAIDDYKDDIIMVNKMNGAGQYFLTQSIIEGFWTTGLINAWGINSEDFWWWENGFEDLYTASGGLQHGASMEKSRYSIPDALIGQMVGLAMSHGACVFSFENSDRLIEYDDTLVPAFTKVIAPLHDLAIKEKVIPTREQVISKIKVAYYADDWTATPLALPGENLFMDLYGLDEHTESWVSTNDCSAEFLPSTGRFFGIPIIPNLGETEGEDTFDTIIESGTMPGNKVTYFEGLYTENPTGTSCAMNSGRTWFITNPYENTNTDTTFGGVNMSQGYYILSGTVKPHSYIYAREINDGISLHVNNYTIDTDTAIWDNEEYTAATFLTEYVDPDCEYATTTRVTSITVDGLSKSSNITSVGGSVVTTWNGDGYTITVTHNGPVDINIKP